MQNKRKRNERNPCLDNCVSLLQTVRSREKVRPHRRHLGAAHRIAIRARIGRPSSVPQLTPATSAGLSSGTTDRPPALWVHYVGFRLSMRKALPEGIARG